MYFQFVCLDFFCIQIENLWTMHNPHPWLYNGFYTVKNNSVSFVEFNQKYPTFYQSFDLPACRNHELWSNVCQNVFFLAEALTFGAWFRMALCAMLHAQILGSWHQVPLRRRVLPKSNPVQNFTAVGLFRRLKETKMWQNRVLALDPVTLLRYS